MNSYFLDPDLYPKKTEIKPRNETQELSAINFLEDHSEPLDDFDKALIRIEKRKAAKLKGGNNGPKSNAAGNKKGIPRGISDKARGQISLDFS